MLMVENPARVERFLERIIQKVQPMLRKELDEIRDFKRNQTEDPTAELGPYDMYYYVEQMDKETETYFDESEMAEYFPLDHIVETTIDIYAELLSLKFHKMEGVSTWMENIPCYRVYD
jgi:Zn-dependent oligopeptidase